jgi:hypothetical protein
MLYSETLTKMPEQKPKTGKPQRTRPVAGSLSV